MKGGRTTSSHAKSHAISKKETGETAAAYVIVDLPVFYQQNQLPQPWVERCIVSQQLGVDHCQTVVDCDIYLEPCRRKDSSGKGIPSMGRYWQLSTNAMLQLASTTNPGGATSSKPALKVSTAVADYATQHACAWRTIRLAQQNILLAAD